MAIREQDGIVLLLSLVLLSTNQLITTVAIFIAAGVGGAGSSGEAPRLARKCGRDVVQ